MNTYLSRLCPLAFVVLVLSACGGGGGGGSGNSAGGTPSAKTKPTTITVIDGYILQGAIVCVDKNENGSCDSGETQGKTGADGKVVLDIPLDVVGKYPIVAYIPADAIDSDNRNSKVGKTYSMSAPADQSAIVSPLSTLVKRLVDKGGNPQTLSPLTITTLAGPTPMIGDITVKTARTASSGALGYDFIMSRGFARGSPVILDTDGNIRWTYTYATDSVIPGGLSPESSAWYDNGFLIGDSKSLNMVRMNLDGSTQKLPVEKYQKYLGASNFHHNMEKGKTGYLGLYDRAAGQGKGYESSINDVDSFYYEIDSDITFTEAVDSDVVEFNPLTGNVIKSWDLKKILSDYMTSQGDTNTLMFNAQSWFHANAAAYDASDNTIVVSSRQNFLIKLKYDTGEIVWIFGDPRKYWYTIPSLRAKALTLDAGGTYPLGQHAVSIPAAGKIMVFNNGNISGNSHPVGADEKPPNPLRSLVSYYTVNAGAKTAVQDWQYDHPEGLYSNVCSSAYMAPDQSLLVLYAMPQRMVGLDASKNIVFDFAYSATSRCSGFNATPVPFGNLNFTK